MSVDANITSWTPAGAGAELQESLIDEEEQDGQLQTGGGKRQQTVSAVSKKPRDNRLRECFTITDEEGQGGGVKIVCKYCQDYVKVLQKFNPTKARTHLTTRCTGVDEALRKSLLGSTQAAKRTLQVEAVADQVGVVPSASIVGTSTTTESLESTTTTSRTNKASVTRRPSPAILSFHPGGNVVDEFLEVSASLQNGDLILTLTFPAEQTMNQLKLNFIAERNSEGAALCIDGFMNMRHEASWTAFLYSLTRDGTRDGPYCQWSLNYGEFEEDMTRVQKVEQLLKVMENH
ncbi:hypothetical protein ACHAWU_005536 [Discostella pseudostelligera]|uniref:BED-type domain-containing protein n=1 Tax=Discostella pseudostelligera TaxID=259834 RepID=A0ABD3N0D5_9STRA